MVLSNTVKICIIIGIAIVCIGIFIWWCNRPEPKKATSASQRFLNEGDHYYELANQNGPDPYHMQRAVESYIEAGNNGDEEGALSMARMFLNDESYYNPERAYQIVRLTLENTRSAVIAQRCFELLEDISHQYSPPPPREDDDEIYTPPPPNEKPNRAPDQPPERLPERPHVDPNEPLHISLVAGYHNPTERSRPTGVPPRSSGVPPRPTGVPSRSSGVHPVQSININRDEDDYSATSLQNMVNSRDAVHSRRPKAPPRPTGRQTARPQHIMINGRPAEILENHGSRVLMMDDEPILLPPDLDVGLIEQDIFNIMANMISNIKPPKTKLEDRMKIRSDSQNVHDSKVTAGAREVYKEASQLPNQKPFKQCEAELLEYIKTDAKKTNTIKQVIARIQTIDTLLSVDANGSQIFCAIWSKITNQPQGEKHTNDMDNFVMELMNCVTTDGTVLCSTGIVNRMLGVFEGTEEYEKPKMIPDSFYNQEMFGAAGKLQEKLEKEGYDFDKEADQERFKQQFRQQMKETYVDGGNLTQTELDVKLLWLNDMF